MLKNVSVTDDGRTVELVWNDDHRARFHAVWLRDNALDDKTRSPGNGQRLITILDIPADTNIAQAAVVNGDLSVRFAPENKTVSFPSAWLRANAYDRARTAELGWIGEGVAPWDKQTMQNSVPRSSYTAATHDPAVLKGWLSAVRTYGFAVMDGLPTESGSLCRIVDLFGYVRETNYGRWFEVRAEVNPNNLAFTNLGLQAHTDNPYRDPVPTLQILACLENTVEGGESSVVDGFAVAKALQRENPEAFRLLSSWPARFEYAGTSDVRLRSKRPMIELGPDGQMLAIRFNNRSLAPAVDVPFEDMPAYYAAYRRFAELIEDPRFEVTFKLEPGQAFIVDNTRVMHARKEFSGTGKRWLQGCYTDKDGLLSTLAAIEETRKEAAE
ncbi:2-trimethylaminoethylphosphonate dioxygenase [Pseudaminobacter soli (ex Li et al. 2025)]|uniref:Gamma-butyrobetaine dioxygenase n=1 Tax=Pseudaminobacter soli (ex Li et al. 2025) TaxID=1295366 RepID=A0A2P7SP16_9HYPH|nr:gamma-butyrobetaine dioxygenase [Mesorhizobium soli]PSJ64213.1 gamma-butyrobetaine dioxygenase [Mesorhizobium soli]